MRSDWQPPEDISAWLVLFEAWLKDRDNDKLAFLAGELLLDILEDRGIRPYGTRRPR